MGEWVAHYLFISSRASTVKKVPAIAKKVNRGNMIAMRVIGLVIAVACFNACIAQSLNTATGIVSSFIGKKANNLFSVMDVNRDDIVEMKELAAIADCLAKKLNIDEEGKKRLYENDVPEVNNTHNEFLES